LEDTLVTDSFGREKAKRAVLQDGSVALGLVVYPVLEVTEDHDPRLGAIGAAVFVSLDN